MIVATFIILQSQPFGEVMLPCAKLRSSVHRTIKVICFFTNSPLFIVHYDVQSWLKKCVLGCVIPPAACWRSARSRNLGQTSLANSVDSTLAINGDMLQSL